MSDTTNLTLNAELQNLIQQLQQKDAGIEVLTAQLDAHKGMLNESLNATLQLKSNLIVVQNFNQKITANLDELKKQIVSLNQQLQDANNRITELDTAKRNEE